MKYTLIEQSIMIEYFSKVDQSLNRYVQYSLASNCEVGNGGTWLINYMLLDIRVAILKTPESTGEKRNILRHDHECCKPAWHTYIEGPWLLAVLHFIYLSVGI